MSLERVYLIRHGQTDWNAEGRWQGFQTVPLNAIGRAQAQALADYWRRPLNAIYSSDLERAWETAEILGRAAGVTPTPDQRLREFNLGIFQGLTSTEQRTRYPAEHDALRADYMGYRLPQGESRYMLQARMFAAWQDFTAHEPGPEIAIVSHGGAIKVLLFKLFGETPELHDLRLENTSITTVECRDGEWRLAGMGETPHLEKVQSDQDEH